MNPNKTKAIKLRQEGKTYPEIEQQLSISRSTLSGWLGKLELSKKAQKRIQIRKEKHLHEARALACLHHRNVRFKRIEQIRTEVAARVKNIDINDRTHKEIALAFLYLGEGFKSSHETGMGNSDPKLLRFFIHALKEIYGLDEHKIYCELHLRADQNENKMKRYWSRQLHIPLTQFKYVYKDPRTKGKPTYKSYNGVCSVRGASVDIQRRLLYTATLLCEQMTRL